jgi:hypothetical protein
MDLMLNDECELGYKCPHSRNTKECPLNHQRLGSVIKKGEPLPSGYCIYERPWEKIRCCKPECSYSHLAGRIDFLLKIGYLSLD